MTEIKEFRIGKNWITAPNKSGTRWLGGVSDEWRTITLTNTEGWWKEIRSGSYWIWREIMESYLSAIRTVANAEPLRGSRWWVEANKHFEPHLYETLWKEEVKIIPIHLTDLKPFVEGLRGVDTEFNREQYRMSDIVDGKGLIGSEKKDVIQQCKKELRWNTYTDWIRKEEYYLKKILEKYEEKK